MTSKVTPESDPRRAETARRADSATPFQMALRDQFVGDVWSRPALSRKLRRWIALTSAAHAGAPGPIEEQVLAALDSGDISLVEMLEFVLHFSVYCGSPKGSYLDGLVARQWSTLQQRGNDALDPWPELPVETLGVGDWQERLAEGAREFAEVNLLPAPVGNSPFRQVGVLGTIFGHVWQRPGLARRDRRVITLTINGIEGTPTPVRTHVEAALRSGDITKEEMDEIVLQFTAHRGFAMGKTLSDAVDTAWAQITA